MSWKDRVPRERITLSRVRDGDMDEAIRAVLSEADRDPAFPRLPPAAPSAVLYAFPPFPIYTQF